MGGTQGLDLEVQFSGLPFVTQNGTRKGSVVEGSGLGSSVSFSWVSEIRLRRTQTDSDSVGQIEGPMGVVLSGTPRCPLGCLTISRGHLKHALWWGSGNSMTCVFHTHVDLISTHSDSHCDRLSPDVIMRLSRAAQGEIILARLKFLL